MLPIAMLMNDAGTVILNQYETLRSLTGIAAITGRLNTSPCDSD